MTSNELYRKLTPYRTEKYYAQMSDSGLKVNLSDLFSILIKDAARCNSYNSDIYYDLVSIEKDMLEYDPEKDFEPRWIGFRKMGVDGTSFVLQKAGDPSCYGSLSSNYFALYSITVEKDRYFYNLILNEYTV
jgi:hypothetical protein